MSKAVAADRLAIALESFEELLLDHPSPQTVLRTAARLAIDHLGASVAISCELGPDGALDGTYTSTADNETAQLLGPEIQGALPSLVALAMSRSTADVMPHFVPFPVGTEGQAWRRWGAPRVVPGKTGALPALSSGAPGRRRREGGLLSGAAWMVWGLGNGPPRPCHGGLARAAGAHDDACPQRGGRSHGAHWQMAHGGQDGDGVVWQ